MVRRKGLRSNRALLEDVYCASEAFRASKASKASSFTSALLVVEEFA